MRKKITLLVCIVLVGFSVKKISDVLTDVGTTFDEVKKSTVEQIASKDFSLPFYTQKIRDACKKLPVGIREATMMSLGKVVKDYVESTQFQSDYNNYIQDLANGKRRSPVKEMDDDKWAAEKKKRADATLKSLSNPDILEMTAKNLDAQIQNSQSMLDILKSSPDLKIGKSKEELEKEIADEKALKDLYGKDKEAFKKQYSEFNAEQQIQTMKAMDKNAQARKQKQIDELKDYNTIIRKQLQQFLDLSADIDFNAELTRKGDKMIFTNPAYEAKPLGWKLCFRSGKEAVTGARKFVQSWLKELK
jgi:hypothetical protein